jgi:hypothetical protein
MSRIQVPAGLVSDEDSLIPHMAEEMENTKGGKCDS